MSSQAASSAWLTPSLPTMLSTTAACWRVIGSPICRTRRSNRRLMSRETSWTRKPKARPTSGRLRSSLPSGNASLGAMTALRKSRSVSIRKCVLHARRAVWPADPACKPFEVKVDDRRRVKGQPLRDEQTADDCDTERTPQLGPGALAEGDRHCAEQRSEGRHHDRPET